MKEREEEEASRQGGEMREEIQEEEEEARKQIEKKMAEKTDGKGEGKNKVDTGLRMRKAKISGKYSHACCPAHPTLYQKFLNCF